MKISQTFTVFFAVIMFFPFASRDPVFATNGSTGREFFLSAKGNDAGTGAIDDPWLTLRKAAQILQAGDVLYVRDVGGTYTDNDAFSPANNGTKDAPITIKAYRNERPVFNLKGSSNLFSLSDKSYFTIEGITILSAYEKRNAYTGLMLRGCQHINVYNMVVDNLRDVDYDSEPEIPVGSSMQAWGSDYIHVRGCFFSGCGQGLLFQGGGSLVHFQACQNLLIEDNYFGNGGHDALSWECGTAGTQWINRPCINVVVQNNIVNNNWGGGMYWGGSFGDGTAKAGGPRAGDGGFPGHNVIQNNIVYNCGTQVKYVKGSIQPYQNEGSIIRGNVVANAGGHFKNVLNDALGMTAYHGAGKEISENRHRFYNNITYFNHGPAVYLGEGWADPGTNIRDIEYKNNIMYGDNPGDAWIFDNKNGRWDDVPQGIYPQIMTVGHNPAHQEEWWYNFPVTNKFVGNIIKAPRGRPVTMLFWARQDVENRNWWKTLPEVEAFAPYKIRDEEHNIYGGFEDNLEVEPHFVKAGDPNNPYDNDFHLQPGSPAIGSGWDLTCTVEAGTNTTSVKVFDALYFTDGAGLITGDPVQIGDNPIVRIAGVDYRENTLTVSKPVTFKKGDRVNLPFNGRGPDRGAFKYTENPEILVDRIETDKDNGRLTILGVITSDIGKYVSVKVTDAKGKVKYIDQVRSQNTGSFKFVIPLPASGNYTVIITGEDVKNPFRTTQYM